MSEDACEPLTGVLVADLSRVLAGPLATMALADLGATVVKVERPGSGDESRAWGPPWTSRTSTYFEAANRSKYGVALDFADAADLARAQALVARADVVVENYRPGALERFGLDYASVAAVNPRAVYCSITGFGDGAGRDRPGYDFLAQAVGGLMSITGDASGEPTKVGVAVVDVLTGKDATIAVLAALADRARTGRGQQVRVELLTSVLGGLVNQGAAYLNTGRPPGRMGNRHPSVVPYQVMQCADGPLAIACGNDAQFGRLVDALGLPSLASDERFVSNGSRVEHRDELIALLEAALAARPALEWEALLVAAGVPAGPVGDIGDAIERAERFELDPLLDVGPSHAKQIRHPARFSSGPLAPSTPPPDIGQHDDAVLAWLDAPVGTPLPRRVDGSAG